MPDRFTREKRSAIMSKIRSKGTKIELKMKEALEKNCIAFQYQPRIFGRPDFLVYPKIAVFCDSSFWHGRNWVKLKKKLPEKYWRAHIESNRRRDRIVNRCLKDRGFIVLRFWDDSIEKRIDDCIKKIDKALKLQAHSTAKEKSDDKLTAGLEL